MNETPRVRRVNRRVTQVQPAPPPQRNAPRPTKKGRWWGWVIGAVLAISVLSNPGEKPSDARAIATNFTDAPISAAAPALTPQAKAPKPTAIRATAIPTAEPANTPGPAPAYAVLKPGNENADVLKMQQALADLGYLSPSSVIGTYGGKTKAAVRWFQQVHDLDADGIAGPMTLTTLYDGEAKAAPEQTKAPSKSAPSSDAMVWLSATGKKYHKINNCGNMNPDKARQVPLDEAKQQYDPCKNCRPPE